MKKYFVPDTNILLQYPDALTGFEDNRVVIMSTVLQELDSFKTAGGLTGYNARETIRRIEQFRRQGDLLKGVRLDNGGMLLVEPDGISDNLPAGYNMHKADNQILSAVVTFKKHKKSPVILVTNDISMRINAAACGIEVESYKNDHIELEYEGTAAMTASEEFINRLYREKEADCEAVMYENEYAVVTCAKQSALCIYRGGKLHLLPESPHPYGVRPYNAMQHFALHALTDPDIPLVILKGAAGTAKTFLALAAGLDQTDRYRKVMITRSNTMTEDHSFGYLPGTLEEKMEPLLAPFIDNLEVLLRRGTKEEEDVIQTQIADMFDTGMIQIAPLAYIRGRSITDSFLILDEAQNVSQNMIKDVITRAGTGTKIVICGDPDQIDNAITLDRNNNGLVYAAEKMKGSPLAAVVTFHAKDSIRSPLAREALMRFDRDAQC